jgi:hypothetical protein
MAAGSGTITFAGTIDTTLAFGSADVPSNVITDFVNGDTIDLLALHETVQAYNGSTLTLVGDQIVTLDLPGNFTKASFHTAPDSGTGTNLTTDVVPCFLAGTMIATPDGEVPVERLVAGARVLTRNGQARHIVWVGTGKVLATSVRRSAATPVIVRKGALADGTPHRDLHITKGHALYIDGVLIPVEELINQRSILWDDRAQEVAIYHVELETHDVMIADGAAAESYRNDGNRWLFQNHNSGWGLSPQPPCAPVLNSGPVVDAIWRRLLERAGSTMLSSGTTTDTCSVSQRSLVLSVFARVRPHRRNWVSRGIPARSAWPWVGSFWHRRGGNARSKQTRRRLSTATMCSNPRTASAGPTATPQSPVI